GGRPRRSDGSGALDARADPDAARDGLSRRREEDRIHGGIGRAAARGERRERAGSVQRRGSAAIMSIWKNLIALLLVLAMTGVARSSALAQAPAAPDST